MREWEIGAVENIHGALPYIRFAPILALCAHSSPSGCGCKPDRQAFNIALALGEVGLLKDSPGPTDTRRKILNDVVNRL